MKALLSAGLISAGAPVALAQSYSASGVGYLQEWEMKANLARTVTSVGEDFSGPVMLRYVGLCSVNGVEEKSGTVRLKVSARSSAIEGTLAIKNERPDHGIGFAILFRAVELPRRSGRADQFLHRAQRRRRPKRCAGRRVTA